METINKTLINEFISAINATDFPSRSIRSKTDVTLAIKNVYFHSDRPVFRRASQQGGQSGMGRAAYKLIEVAPFRERVEDLLDSLGSRIWVYFNLEPNKANNQPNFDEFHEQLCDSFLDGINPIRAAVGYAPMSYGQAQKLINLTFKYLTCYGDYSEFADLFRYCHMTVDAIVIGKLRDKEKMMRILGTQEEIGSMRLSNLSWTRFSKNDYKTFLNESRRVLSTYLGTRWSFMHLEYCLWAKDGVTLSNAGEIQATPINEFHM